MNIFARFYFRAARLEREKRENKCSAKISTFTVIIDSRQAIFLYDLDYLYNGYESKFDLLFHSAGNRRRGYGY